MNEPAEHHKRVVSLLVQAIGRGDLGVFDELYTARAASKAREWVGPFLESFPDVRMDIVRMISDGDTVVARLRCSGTHLGVWRGHAPTGKRFERVDEVYFFTFRNGLIDSSWGIKDNLARFSQLGLVPGSWVCHGAPFADTARGRFPAWHPAPPSRRAVRAIGHHGRTGTRAAVAITFEGGTTGMRRVAGSGPAAR